MKCHAPRVCRALQAMQANEQPARPHWEWAGPAALQLYCSPGSKVALLELFGRQVSMGVEAERECRIVARVVRCDFCQVGLQQPWSRPCEQRQVCCSWIQVQWIWA